MELGAQVCTGRQQPDCSACPICKHCKAYIAVQDYASRGADPDSVDAPQVLQYPAKVL